MSKSNTKTSFSLRIARIMRGSLKLVLFFIALTGVFLYTRVSTPTHVEAATSSNLNFQARLLNASGAIVPDGTYNVEFKLYNASSSSGSSQGSCSGDANCLWTETRTGGNKVTVKSGYLSVYLGSVTSFPSINWDQDLYLTMNIGGTGAASWDGEMTPRLKLTAVPYAFAAGQIAKYNGSQTGTLSFNTVANSPDIKLPDISGTNNVLLQAGTTLFTQGSIPYTDSSGRLAQDNANFFYDGTNHRLGLGTATPQNTLSLASGKNFGIYNTADETVNYQRLLTSWSSTNATISAEAAGSAGNVALRLQSKSANGSSAYIDVDRGNTNSAGVFSFKIDSTAVSTVTNFSFTASNGLSASSGNQNFVAIQPNVLQTSTAGYTALLINSTESTVGSGAKMLVDLQVGGVSKANFSNTGALTLGRIATSGTVSAGNLLFADGTTDNFSATLQAATQTANTIFQLPAASAGTYSICTTANNCAGLGAFINNTTSTQSNANFNVQSAADGSITGVIRVRASQTADLLQFQNSGGTAALSGFDSTGSLYIKDTTSGFKSTIAVQGSSLSADRTVYLPNVGGTICTSANNCVGPGGAGDVYKNGQTGPLVLGTTDNTTFSFITNNISRALFDSSNNLYLGNAGSTGTAASPNNFVLQGTGSSTAGTAGANLTVSGGAGATATTGSAGGVLALQGGAAGGSGNNNGGNVTIDGGAKTGSGTQGYVVLQGSGGNVGIGTATPGSQLHVSGAGTNGLFKITDTTATAQDVLTVADGGATTLRNQTNSTAAFQVQSAASGTDVLTVDTTNSQTILRGTNSDAVIGSELVTSQAFNNATYWTCGAGWTTTATTAQHTVNTNTCVATSSNMTITSGATYQVSFTVAGQSAGSVTPSIGGVSGVAITADTTTTQVITGTATTNLTFTPTTDFNGTISAVSVKLVTLANSVLTVKNSSNAINLEVRASGTTSNTFVGLTAGQSNTTGTSNTAFGLNALQDNTTGGSNTAVGANSLQSNTTGSNNTGLGRGALQNNTTGGYNTGVGTFALALNTVGSQNTALGYLALQMNTTGNSNNAVGHQALTSNTTGSYNVALGDSALRLNSSGTENIAIGHRSLENNLTNSGSVAIGYDALRNSTGGGNTAIGRTAGNSITSGTNNTFLGYYAGYQDPSATSFVTLGALSNATALGYGAQVQASNSLVLGGQASNAVNVGIGTTIPTNTLSVAPLQYNTGTISQSASTTVVGSGTTFTSAMVGSQIIYADGTSDTITAFTDATHVTVTTSRTHSSSVYRIHYAGLQVTSAGSVGIGTATPGAKLDVVAANDGIRLLSGAAGSYTFLQLGRTAAEGDLGIAASSGNFFTGSVAGDFSVRATASGGRLALTTSNFTSTSSGAVLLKSGDVTGGSGLTTGAINIQSGDGSGTNTSSGNININAGAVTGSGTKGYVVLQGSGGNVGIGTSSPGYALDVRNNTSSQLHLSSSTSDDGAYILGLGSGIYLSGGAAFSNGTNWVAKTTTASIIDTASGALDFFSNSGLTVGNTYTPTLRFQISATGDITTGVGGNNNTIQTQSRSGASQNTGNLTVQSGNATGSTSNSGSLTIDAGTATGTAGTISIGTANQSGLTLGRSGASTTINGNTSSSIALGNFTVSSAGAVTAVGVNSGTGLLQGTGGLTLTGTTSINGSGTANTTIGNSAGGTITIGASSGSDLALQDAQWSVTGAGAATFASVTSGTATFTGANALTLGTASTNTGAIVFKGSGGTGTLTVSGPTTPNAGNYTLTIPAITANANICTDNSVCAGYQASPASGSYLQQVPGSTAANTVTPTANSVVGLTINGTSGTAATALSVLQGGNATALNVSGSGTGNLAILDTTNASANGVSIDVQSSSSSQYALKVTTNNGANVALQVRGDGRLTASSLISCDKVYSDSSGVISCGTGVEKHVSKIEFTGHSQTYGYGATDPSQRWSTKLSKLLQATEVNRGINGAIAIGSSTSNGGWVNVVQNVTRTRTSAPYLSPTNMASIELGHNDLQYTSTGGTNQFKHAIRTIISRYRSAAVFEESSSTISFSGTWSTQAGSANSGTGYKQTSTNGDTYTISVPSDFPGGTVTVGLIGVTGGNGALHSYTVDGGSAGSLNTKSIASVSSLGLSIRFTGLSAGAHTIVGTISSVTGNTGVDYWQIEAQQPPLITVVNATRALSYLGAVTDTDVNNLNSAMQSVVNEFDSSVVYVDIDAVINKNSSYFTSDGIHYNDLGNAKIAETVYQAVATSTVPISQLSYTGGTPYTSDTEVFRNSTNNANAFSIQNAAGNNVLSVNTSINSVGIGVIGTPAALVGIGSSSGGSLATNTYYYKVTALDGLQESDPSSETSASVTGPNASVNLSWYSVPGATSYRIYRGTSSGGENVYYTSTTNSYTDTNASSTGGSPPSAITSSTKLHVVGTAGSGAEIRVEVKDNTTAQLTIGRNETGGSYNSNWAVYMPASTTDLRIFNATPFKDLAAFSQTGAVTFQNSTNSTSAFRVLPSNATFGSGTPVLDVDTSNSRVGLGTSTPGYQLDLRNNTSAQLHITTGNGDDGAYIMGLSPNSLFVTGGVSWNGANWVAKDTTAGIFDTTGGAFQFYSNSGLTVGNTYTPTLRFSIDGSGNGDFAGTLFAGTSDAFQVSSAGAVTAVGVNSGTGLLQGTGGLTLTGTTSINGSGTANTTIGNSAGGTITIGASSGSDLALQDAQWSVTGAGAATFASGQINGNLTVGASAGSGTLFTNNGATVNSTLALGDFASGGSIGSAATTVDIYTAVSIAQTTASQSLTIPTPTASTTYGRLLYISNIGTTSFTLLGSTINPGSTATLIWANKNGGAAWTFAGADGSSILNQNAAQQASANFWISGSGRADTSFLTPAIDVPSAGTLSLGTTTATAVSISKTGVTTTINGALTVSQASQLNGNLTVGASAGSGTLFTNNGATVNTVLALGNFGTGGAIGTAAATVDIYTYISVAQTTASQTLTIPTPTASTTYGRLLYISNIGTTSFTLLGVTINAGSTATLIWTNTNGAASWTFAGADGSAILNQNSTDQTANFRISGTGRANTSFTTPLLDAIGSGTLGVGTATTGNLTVGNVSAGGSNSTTLQAATGGVTIQTATSQGGGNTGSITLQTGNASSGNGNTSGSITIKTGDGTNGSNGSSGSISIDVGAKSGASGTAGSISIGTGTNTPAAITISKTSGAVTNINGGLTLGASAGSGTLLLNNGATVNSTLALGNFNYTGSGNTGSIGSAATTVDIYTAISIAQTTASQTLTIPTPTASTTYGRIIYISNIGTASFTVLGVSINPGVTTTLIWTNANGGATWTFAGADGNGILNQNGSDQTANFRITGTGRANTSFTSPLFDAISGALGIGTSTTNALSIGNTSASFTAEGNSTVNLFAGATAHTIALGSDNTTTQGITIGSTSASSTTAIRGGTGSSALTLQVGSGGTISLGTSTASTINVGTGAFAHTIAIGTDGTTTQGITIGSSSASSTTAIQGGTGSSAVSIQSGASGTINIGTANAANTIQIGNTANAIAQTINIGNNATGSSANTIVLGSNVSSSGTTIQGGSNGIILGNNGTTNTSVTVNGTEIVKTGTNSSTAFQVQNSTGAPIFLVDTTTNNLVTNPGFEVNTTGWGTSGSGTGLAIAQNTNKTKTYHGLASLLVTTASGTANTGASATSFTSSLTPGTYTLSFYAMGGSTNGTFSTLSISLTGGTVTTPCTLNSTSVVTTGFNRYSCTFVFTTTNVTAINFIVTDTTQHTFYLDAVQLTNTSTVVPYQIGSIQLRGVITNPLTLMNNADSTTAFQIQNAAGTSNLLVADTLNSRVGIGTSTPGYQLDLRGNTSAQLHINSTSSDNGAYILGGSNNAIFLMGGVSWNGSAWLAKDTTASIFDTSSGAFDFFSNSGLTIGNTYSPTQRFQINATGDIITGFSGAANTVQTQSRSGASQNTGNLTIQSGNATGTTSNSGNVSVDAGTATGTAGTVSIATGNASALSLGRSGVTTTNNGALTVSQLLTGNLGLTVSGATSLTGGISNVALTVSGTQPTAVSGAGTAATAVLSVTGAKGGNTNGGTATAGAGGAVTITTGAGGDAVSGSTNGIGGAGGAITITSGAGGASLGTAVNANGGTITLQGGAPGTGGSGTAGSYGNIVMQSSGGNVGIGASSPAFKLHVTSNSDNGIFVDDNSSSAIGIGGGINFGASAAGANTVFGKITLEKVAASSGDSSFDLAFSTKRDGQALTERMRLDSLGQLGIGVTAPAAMLHVVGYQAAASSSPGGSASAIAAFTVTGGQGGTLNYSSGTGTAGSGGAISLTSGVGGSTAGAGTLTAGTSGAVTIATGAGGAATSTNSIGGNSGTLTISTGAGGASTGTAVNSSGGNIVLQTGAPGTGGSGTAGSYGNITMQTSGGNVGIGTTAPAAKLQITGNVLAQVDSATAFQVQNAAGATALNLETTGATNVALNSGGETGGTPPTSWAAHGSATVTQTTVSGEYASGTAAVKAATTGSSQGARNNVGTGMSASTTYNISFSIKTSVALTNANLTVRFSPDGTTSNNADCSAMSSPTISTSAFIKYTCTLTTTSTTTTASAYLAIFQADATSRNIFIDNLSITAQSTSSTTGTLRVGGLASQGLTLFTLDSFASTPFTGTTNTSLLGSMYYDTTLGRIQCYEADGWGTCSAGLDTTITLTPEYAGMTLNGSGVGTFTSDFCSGSGHLNIPTTGNVCGASEERNFYSWTTTQSSAQTYSMFIRYQMPSNFRSFFDDNTIQLTGRTSDTSDSFVKLSLYNASGTQCGSLTTVNSSNNTWQTTSMGGSGETGCSISANDIVTFKIDMTAGQNDTVRVGDLTFKFKSL